MINNDINYVKINQYNIDYLSYDLKDLFTYFNTYLICNDDEILGAYEVLSVYNGLEIRIGINQNKRNNGLGSELLNVIFHKVGMEYNLYDNIKLFIRPSNKASIGMANKCGFMLDCDNLMENESEGYLIFNKKNPYYEEVEKHVRK